MKKHHSHMTHVLYFKSCEEILLLWTNWYWSHYSLWLSTLPLGWNCCRQIIESM